MKVSSTMSRRSSRITPWLQRPCPSTCRDVARTSSRACRGCGSCNSWGRGTWAWGRRRAQRRRGGGARGERRGGLVTERRGEQDEIEGQEQEQG